MQIEISTFTKKMQDFNEASTRLSVLDDFSEKFSERRKLFESLDAHMPQDLKEIAIAFEDIIEKFLFVTLVNRRKIDGIVSLLIFSINSKNPIALAQGVRALVEHACILCMVAYEIEKLKVGIKGQNEIEKIRAVLSRSEIFLYRCYFGKSGKVVKEKGSQALHINDGLDALKARLPSVIDDYDYLCEFVHPNYGSNLLVSVSEIQKYITSLDSNFDRIEINRMVSIGGKVLSEIESNELFIYSLCGILSSIANRFTAYDAKITNIFSVRKPVIKGNGKSKETALYVTNGRDSGEEIEFIYGYLDKNSFNVYGRAMVGMEDGFIYDLYKTNKGEVWVKISLAKV
jgi:hypothetical protein